MPLILASEFSDSFDKTQKLLGDNLSGKTVTIIPTASRGEGWEPAYDTNIKPFEDLGMVTSLFDIEEKTSQEVKETMLSSDIIYVTGGNTFYLLKHMQDCNFKDALNTFFNKGGIYIGSSAGSIVMSPDIEFISMMDNPNIDGLNDFTGLNMVDFSFLPHLDHTEMGKDAHKIIEKYKYTNQTIIALNDNEALYIDGNIVKLI